MKKLLFIHSSLGGGGAERVLIDILRHFDYSKYVIDLVLVNGTGIYLHDVPNQVKYLGCIYKKRRGVIKRIIAKLRLNCLFEPFEIRKLVKDKYDTIVSFMESYPARYHSYILNKATRNVSWVHSDFRLNHWSKRRYISDKEEASVYEKMDKVVFVSNNAEYSFRQLFQYKTDNLIVINNPIDRDRILQLADEYKVVKDCFTFVAVGRLSSQKRYDRMLGAVKILKDRGCVFCLNILGAGGLEEDLKRMALNLGIDSYVNFMGFISNPYPYIKSADVFVLSSDTEGFSTVVCEAMTLGTPVIGTDVTGVKDIIGASKFGLLSETTEDSFADAMYIMYSEANKRDYYAIKSLEKAETLSLESAIDRIYGVI